MICVTCSPVSYTNRLIYKRPLASNPSIRSLHSECLQSLPHEISSIAHPLPHLFVRLDRCDSFGIFLPSTFEVFDDGPRAEGVQSVCSDRGGSRSVSTHGEGDGRWNSCKRLGDRRFEVSTGGSGTISRLTASYTLTQSSELEAKGRYRHGVDDRPVSSRSRQFPGEWGRGTRDGSRFRTVCCRGQRFGVSRSGDEEADAVHLARKRVDFSDRYLPPSMMPTHPFLSPSSETDLNIIRNHRFDLVDEPVGRTWTGDCNRCQCVT